MEGGTVFHFVDASPAEALDLARQAAGDRDVRIGGGPSILRDFLAADLIDVVHLVQVPILLGRGVRLWGRSGRPRGALRDRGRLVTERCHAPDAHASIDDQAAIRRQRRLRGAGQ